MAPASCGGNHVDAPGEWFNLIIWEGGKGVTIMSGGVCTNITPIGDREMNPRVRLARVSRTTLIVSGV